jgi:hypothetical protein
MYASKDLNPLRLATSPAGATVNDGKEEEDGGVAPARQSRAVAALTPSPANKRLSTARSALSRARRVVAAPFSTHLALLAFNPPGWTSPVSPTHFIPLHSHSSPHRFWTSRRLVLRLQVGTLSHPGLGLGSSCYFLPLASIARAQPRPPFPAQVNRTVNALVSITGMPSAAGAVCFKPTHPTPPHPTRHAGVQHPAVRKVADARGELLLDLLTNLRPRKTQRAEGYAPLFQALDGRDSSSRHRNTATPSTPEFGVLHRSIYY